MLNTHTFKKNKFKNRLTAINLIVIILKYTSQKFMKSNETIIYFLFFLTIIR